MYSVDFLPSAAKTLMRRRVAHRVDRLAFDPHVDAAMLRGADDVWRVRVGDLRVLYRIENDRLLILIIRIGHRRDVYR
jgi:mRNA interferase RelE/StbE